MHYFGQDAISRPTRRSARTLVSLSLVFWLIGFYTVPVEQLVISGISLPGAKEALSALRWVVLLFSFADHLMNWFADLLSYKAWNVRDKLTSRAGFGTDTGLMNKLESVILIVNEKMPDPSSSAERKIALSRLEEIKTEVWRLNSYAAWYLAVWIGAPALCCVVALVAGLVPA